MRICAYWLFENDTQLPLSTCLPALAQMCRDVSNVPPQISRDARPLWKPAAERALDGCASSPTGRTSAGAVSLHGALHDRGGAAERRLPSERRHDPHPLQGAGATAAQHANAAALSGAPRLWDGRLLSFTRVTA